jgi:adenylate cyclase
MSEQLFSELGAWVTQAGLADTPETDIVSEFCGRCVAAGLPLARSMMFIDTLHPVHEGHLFRWGFNPNEAPLLEYGRTSPDALAASGSSPQDLETAQRWRRSPHYRMVQTGETFLRRRLNGTTEDEFPLLTQWRAEGITDYLAIITPFAADGAIGEMDALYSSWATNEAAGFKNEQIAALERVVPILHLPSNRSRSRA